MCSDVSTLLKDTDSCDEYMFSNQDDMTDYMLGSKDMFSVFFAFYGVCDLVSVEVKHSAIGDALCLKDGWLCYGGTRLVQWSCFYVLCYLQYGDVILVQLGCGHLVLCLLVDLNYKLIGVSGVVKWNLKEFARLVLALPEFDFCREEL